MRARKSWQAGPWAGVAPSHKWLIYGSAKKWEGTGKPGQRPREAGTCGLCPLLHALSLRMFCQKLGRGRWAGLCAGCRPQPTQLQFDPLLPPSPKSVNRTTGEPGPSHDYSLTFRPHTDLQPGLCWTSEASRTPTTCPALADLHASSRPCAGHWEGRRILTLDHCP